MANQVLIISANIEDAGIAAIAENAAKLSAGILAIKVSEPSSISSFTRITNDIKAKLGNKLIVQLQLENSVPEEFMDLVQSAKPESVLIPLRKLIPAEDYQIEAEEFLTWLKENKTIIQYEINNADELLYFADLCDQRIIPEGDDFILLDYKGNASLEKLTKFLKLKDENNIKVKWVVTSSLSEEKIAKFAMQKGGGISVKPAEVKELLEKIL